MAEIKSLICDMCGNQNATGYSIGRRGGAPWYVDLCDTCSAPIHSWQLKGRAPAGKKRPYRKYGVKAQTA